MNINIITLATIAIFLSGCCTRKDCGLNDSPLIMVTIEDLNPSYQGYIIVMQENSGTKVDSIQIYNNPTYISSNYLGYPIIGNTFYIHSDSNRVDTLNNISYEEYSEIRNCNTCFMRSDQQVYFSYRNLSYYVNNELNTTESITLYP